MDWNRYKRLCDSPGVFSRWMLEQTLLLADAAEVDCLRLRDALSGTPLAKPADHTGGSMTDMFELDLEHDQVVAIVELVARAVASGETTPATRGRGLGGFLEAWREYAEFLRTSGPVTGTEWRG